MAPCIPAWSGSSAATRRAASGSGLFLNQRPRSLDRPVAALCHLSNLKVLDEDDAVFLGEHRGCLVHGAFRCRAHAACNLAIRCRAFARLREPLWRRATTRCASARRFLSAVVVRGRSITVPSERTIGWTPPRSMPISVPRFTGTTATSCSTWIATNQSPATAATVTFFTLPTIGRCITMRVHPDFGIKMRLSSIFTCFGSGCRKASFWPFFRNFGKPARLSKKFLNALCRSKIVCCSELAGASLRKSNSRFNTGTSFI